MQSLAFELKAEWDAALKKKEEDAARERRYQQTMQEIEEVAGLVPPPPIPIQPPRPAARNITTARVPVMPDQRSIPANAPPLHIFVPYLIIIQQLRMQHHHIAGSSSPSPIVHTPFITPRREASPEPSPLIIKNDSAITFNNPTVPNATVRVVAPSNSNPPLQPIHMRNRDMVNRIDEGHILATTIMNRLDDLLNRRPDGVNTSQVFNNLTGFMSTVSNLPGGNVHLERVAPLVGDMITHLCDELDLP